MKYQHLLLILTASSVLLSCTTTERVSVTSETVQEFLGEREPVVMYIDAPEVRYSESVEDDSESLGGAAALKQNMSDRIIQPEYSQGRLRGWVYREGDIYEIHCQTYHSTVLQLEPGEEMVEVPYLSETDVWRISRGVGVKDGKTCQFLMIKPDYSGLESTLVILTNRRVYQILLKSFKDHYMPYVQWAYNTESGISDLDSWKQHEASQTETAKEVARILLDTNLNAEYKISYGLKRPSWTPTIVCDNGQKTYIVLDRRVLNMEMPAVFKNKRDIVNYNVDENIITINELVNKITLRLGNETVTIKRK